MALPLDDDGLTRLVKSMPIGDYYVDGKECVDRISGYRYECISHWDACMLMMGANDKSRKEG